MQTKKGQLQLINTLRTNDYNHLMYWSFIISTFSRVCFILESSEEEPIDVSIGELRLVEVE